MTNQQGKSFYLVVFFILAGVLAVSAQSVKPERQYRINLLGSLGGTNSRGNNIDERGWVTGYSNFEGNQYRHATLWRRFTVSDLGTLGSPERNSNVTWTSKNTDGLIVGISQTDTPMPLGENWSCASFFPPATATGYTCLGFVWNNGSMRRLEPLPGGNNSFATGANNRGQVVGWAENGIFDPTCVANNQVLQFRPVYWQARNGAITELPTLTGDSSGAVTAINERGRMVGISGDCDQAVGRRTARNAVVWYKGRVRSLGDFEAEYWNTPTAINQRGDIIGFAGTPGDPEGSVLRAFIWTRRGGIRYLSPLTNLGHTSAEAYGINERRQVVGLSCFANGVNCRAVIWENGTVRDLNDLKDSSVTVLLEQARDINERGEITGRTFNPATNERLAFTAIPNRREND